MKIKSIANLGLAFVAVSFISCGKQQKQTNLSTEIDSVSYAYGAYISNSFRANFDDVNDAAFIEGYNHQSDSLKRKLNKEDINKVLQAFFLMQRNKDLIKKDSAKIKNTTAELMYAEDSVSYAIGLNVAGGLKPIFPDVNNELFVKGFLEAKDTTTVLIASKEAAEISNGFLMNRYKKQQEEKQMAEYGEVKKESEKFLEENKTKEGVITTASGLQYIVLKEGDTTKKPASSAASVTVHYHGTILDGTVFDSSVDGGQPITFTLDRVIKGWTEGVQLMGEGAKYKFFIPQDLAYGANPPGGVIKPFMALIFEVELIKVN